MLQGYDDSPRRNVRPVPTANLNDTEESFNKTGNSRN